MYGAILDKIIPKEKDNIMLKQKRNWIINLYNMLKQKRNWIIS